MATFLEFTATSLSNIIQTIASFAAENGWTVNVSTSTNTTITKNGRTFSISASGNYSLNLTATIDGLTTSNIYVDGVYYGSYSKVQRLFSCGDDLFIMTFCNVQRAFGLFTISKKVGSWEGGSALTGGALYGSQSTFNASSSMPSALYINGSWVNATSLVSGQLVGSRDLCQSAKKPNYFNGAIIPIPIMFYQRGTNTSQYIPLGSVGTVFQCGAGESFYKDKDTITIAGVDYVFDSGLGLLFKVS